MGLGKKGFNSYCTYSVEKMFIQSSEKIYFGRNADKKWSKKWLKSGRKVVEK